MRKNTLEIKEPEEPLKRLARKRGILELVLAVIGLSVFVMMFTQYSSYFSSIWSLLSIIYSICITLLTLVCGIMSFRRPYEFIWPNLILGGLAFASAIRVLIGSLVVGEPVAALIGVVFGVAIGSAILYPTIRIRRGLPRQPETRPDGGV